MSGGLAVELLLPLPPSVNAAYRDVRGRGRVCTDALKGWKRHAGALILAERIRAGGVLRVAGHVSVRAEISSPGGRGDLDNRSKALLDVLVEQAVIDDDQQVLELHLLKRVAEPGGVGAAFVRILSASLPASSMATRGA